MSTKLGSSPIVNTIINNSIVSNYSDKPTFDSDIPIIVYSHLRWDWVWQRPQQFLSRLANKHRILFVEYPPLFTDVSDPTYRLKPAEQHSNIMVLQMHFPQAAEAGAADDHAAVTDEVRLDLVQQALKSLPGKFEKPLLWFYDPMAVSTYLGKMNETSVVYDCMDQLSQFRFAPPELIARERQLLAVADVVFTGGRKMWEDKRRFNDNCHFYGCGVDVKHFSQARETTTAVPEDIASLSRPIAGYFGVVDERLDYDLIARLADANPGWSIVMVGPACKVDPADLPQRPNLHWLGGREYNDLPAYARAFDVCLMPFARNEATEFINPTKALEYMATATPIVSTAVPDVVSNFSEVVAIANTPEEFLDLCFHAVTEPSPATIERGLQMAGANTWEAIVACLDQHIQEALQERVRKSNGTLRSSKNATTVARSFAITPAAAVPTAASSSSVSALLVPST